MLKSLLVIWPSCCFPASADSAACCALLAAESAWLTRCSSVWMAWSRRLDLLLHLLDLLLLRGNRIFLRGHRFLQFLDFARTGLCRTGSRAGFVLRVVASVCANMLSWQTAKAPAQMQMLFHRQFPCYRF